VNAVRGNRRGRHFFTILVIRLSSLELHGTSVKFARSLATTKPRLLELNKMSRRVTLRVQPPIPFGDVTIMPSPFSGRPEAEMARAMAAALGDVEAPTAAEVYGQLRQAFPFAPLAARVGALANLMDRLRRPAH
jgi:hypothetical protein